MTFQAFFQENIIYFIALFIVVAAILYLEWRDRRTIGRSLTTIEASRMINDQATLIDLRSAEEFRKGHIAGAKNFPLASFNETYPKINKNKPVIIYCKNGMTSQNAAKILHDNGYSDVYNLGGGYESWVNEKLPVVV